MRSRLGPAEAKPSLEQESANEPVNVGRQVHPCQSRQVTINPFVTLNGDEVQNEIALR